MFIEGGKKYLDVIVDCIREELNTANKNIPVFVQHFLRPSDTGRVPFVSVILDRIDKSSSTIGRALQLANIYYLITLVEKYKEETLFTDLPTIEQALMKVQGRLPQETESADIISIEVAYEEIGNLVLQASQISFVVEASLEYPY